MKLYVGTSGYSYKEWKGSFYPHDLPDKEMLSFYAERLPAVEINNTFYRMPNVGMLQAWNDQVPGAFQFVLKASRKITHSKPLKEKESEVTYLFKTAASLEQRLGVILFQLPPYFRYNVDVLQAFLQALPDGPKCAFEFRHRSWFQDDVFALLHEHDAALCCSDTEDRELSRLQATANWGYLRLRRPDYTDADLEAWVQRIYAQGWDSAYVFFKHEDEGAGPRLARRFMEMPAPETA